MATYIPHREGTVQTIVRGSFTRYRAYANPPQDVMERLIDFTGCADWSKGLARIRCPDCGHSYFRPFSCKVFHLCPSCDQKRTLLYAEYLAEDLLLDLPHRQFVFTIPKILRPYFKADKRLFGEVSRLIFSLLSDFFLPGRRTRTAVRLCGELPILWRVCQIPPTLACPGSGRRIYQFRPLRLPANRCRRGHAQGLASGDFIAVPAQETD